MAKTLEQLHKEVNATVKLVLIEMEDLASLPPEKAANPYDFDIRRRRVVRKIWDLMKDCLNYTRETDHIGEALVDDASR